jgi:hypothetical protein
MIGADYVSNTLGSERTVPAIAATRGVRGIAERLDPVHLVKLTTKLASSSATEAAPMGWFGSCRDCASGEPLGC